MLGKAESEERVVIEGGVSGELTVQVIEKSIKRSDMINIEGANGGK